MRSFSNLDYSKSVAERLKEILALIGLEIAGFAQLINRSPAHIYGILNSQRDLSKSLGREIGDKVGFDGNIIFKLNTPIPKSIATTEQMIAFRTKYKDSPEFFTETRKDRSIDYFIQFELIPSGFFTEGYKYVNEIRRFCNDVPYKKGYSSDQLSKGLKYAVSKGLLNSKKEFIKKHNGNLGERLVDVFFLPESRLK